MTKRFKLIASLYILLIRNGKILLLRRFNTGYEDGKYSVPAGHLEAHETLIQGLRREVREEIGIVLDSGNISLVHIMHRKHLDERIDYFFTAEKWTGTPKNMEPEKCDDLKWFDIDTLAPNTIPYIRTAIRNFKKNILYSEFGW